jgi:hypothetical protein
MVGGVNIIFSREIENLIFDFNKYLKEESVRSKNCGIKIKRGINDNKINLKT